MATLKSEMYRIHGLMKTAPIIHRGKWQGKDLTNNPAGATHELRHVVLSADLGTMDKSYYITSVGPDMPWADVHFEERVGGIPLNPQPSEDEWAHTVGGNQEFKRDGKQHSHTYAERFWPKYAGKGEKFLGNDQRGRPRPGFGVDPIMGIRYQYGDLWDLVLSMKQDPFNRQGILPMFFPEDTGVTHNDRKPCTVAYQFMRTGDELDVTYFIRSCDYHRHFRNDVYFAIRLCIWMISELRTLDGGCWAKVRPGRLTMLMTSLHTFRNDHIRIFGNVG